MSFITEQQKIQQIKTEAIKTVVRGISVDFKPMLRKVKELITADSPKEEIIREIDRALNLIAQLEKLSDVKDK